MLRIALRSSGGHLRPYIGNYHTNGASQKAFTERFGKPMGRCMRSSKTMPVTKRAIECSHRGGA